MARKRNTGTEAKIKAAFTQLLKEKGFDSMTVSDIARIAGINRGTFYMHYMDKFDLRQQLLDNALFDLQRILRETKPEAPAPESDAAPSAGTPAARAAALRQRASVLDVIAPQSTLAALRYIRNDAAFFDAVTHSGQDMTMYEETKKLLRKLLKEKAELMHIRPSLSEIPREYGTEVVVSSVTSIIWLWVRRGFAETPEEITRYIEINKRMTPLSLLR